MEILVASVAKVGGTEAKVNSDRTTVSAFVFQKIGSVFWAYPRSGDIAAAAAHQLFRIEFRVVHFGFATSFASVVSLYTPIIGLEKEGSAQGVLSPMQPD